MARRTFVAVVIGLFLYVASPLLSPISMGAVLAILLWPLFERLEKRNWPLPVASGALTLGITFLFLMPASLLLAVLAKNAFFQLQTWKDAPKPGAGLVDSIVNFGPVHHLLEWVTKSFPVDMQDLVETVTELARSVGLRMTELLAGMMTRVPGMALAIAVIILSTYFFLLDGRKAIQFVRRNSFFSTAQTDQLVHTMAAVCRSVILASVLSGAAQALVEGVACLAVGAPDVMLIAGLVFMGSFVPLVGSAPVTLGVAAHQFLVGNTTGGIVLSISAVLVAGLDNFIRPMFLKGSANLHPLLAFVAAFGGLKTLGVLGIFFGPIIAAMFVATIQVLLQDTAQKNAG